MFSESKIPQTRFFMSFLVAVFRATAIALTWYLALATTPAEAATYTAKRVWDTAIGTPSPRTVVSLCVSPVSGNVYALTSGGQWSILDSSGRIVAQKQSGELAGATSIACGLSGELYVGLPASRTIRTYDSTFALVRAVNTTVPFGRFRVTASGTIYLVAPWAGHPVYKLLPSGDVQPIGTLPKYASPQLAQANAASAALYVDEEHGRLIYKPHNPFQFFVYDLNGNLISSQLMEDPNFKSITDAAPTTPIVTDDSREILPLSDGGFLVQVFKAMPARAQLYTGTTEFQFFDEQLRPSAAPIPSVGGIPQAIDAADNIYGVIGAPQLRITKVHIQRNP